MRNIISNLVALCAIGYSALAQITGGMPPKEKIIFRFKTE